MKCDQLAGRFVACGEGGQLCEDCAFESLLLASKKAQAEMLAKVRAAEPSCEELEARREIALVGADS